MITRPYGFTYAAVTDYPGVVNGNPLGGVQRVKAPRSPSFSFIPPFPVSEVIPRSASQWPYNGSLQ